MITQQTLQSIMSSMHQLNTHIVAGSKSTHETDVVEPLWQQWFQAEYFWLLWTVLQDFQEEL